MNHWSKAEKESFAKFETNEMMYERLCDEFGKGKLWCLWDKLGWVWLLVPIELLLLYGAVCGWFS